MNGGLFITLYDDRTLALYLKYGIYGFLMPPIMAPKPSTYSRHYCVLADYACSRQGTHIFFFLKRRIVYGGAVKGNAEIASFYLNGKTSPLGRVANAELFWDESQRYAPTDQEGIFKVRGKDRAQPFVLQFKKNDTVAGYRKALDLIHKKHKSLCVTPEIIKEMHRLCRGESWDTGKWKEKDNDIIRKYPDIFSARYLRLIRNLKSERRTLNLCEEQKHKLLCRLSKSR